MRRRVPADPLCSGLLRLPHVHLTIVDGFADPSPTRDSNACRRIVGRGLAAAVDAGLAEGRGRMSAAVGRRRRRRAPCGRGRGVVAPDRGIVDASSGGSFPRAAAHGALKASRVRRHRALPATTERGCASRSCSGAREAEVASRDRGRGSSGPRRTGACLSLWSSLNWMTNQCVTSCRVARTVVEVRYLFRRRAGCVGN